MKQTAVEWYQKAILEILPIENLSDEMFLQNMVNAYLQAKGIEKQQIIDALKAGVNFEIDYGNSTKINYNKYSEQYYKETFNK